MDNYRELKIRCDPGFGHLRLLLSTSVSSGLNLIEKNQLQIILMLYHHLTIYKSDHPRDWLQNALNSQCGHDLSF